MANKGHKFYSELTAEEKESRLKDALNAELEKAKAMNQPIIYRNELCVKPNQFIHKYPDGRTELIEQDSTTAEEKIIKVLK